MIRIACGDGIDLSSVAFYYTEKTTHNTFEALWVVDLFLLT